jgi:hypothetical protein
MVNRHIRTFGGRRELDAAQCQALLHGSFMLLLLLLLLLLLRLLLLLLLLLPLLLQLLLLLLLLLLLPLLLPLLLLLLLLLLLRLLLLLLLLNLKLVCRTPPTLRPCRKLLLSPIAAAPAFHRRLLCLLGKQQGMLGCGQGRRDTVGGFEGLRWWRKHAPRSTL